MSLSPPCCGTRGVDHLPTCPIVTGRPRRPGVRADDVRRSIAEASRVVDPIGYAILERRSVAAHHDVAPWSSCPDHRVFTTYDAATLALGSAIAGGADAMLVQLVPVPTVPRSTDGPT